MNNSLDDFTLYLDGSLEDISSLIRLAIENKSVLDIKAALKFSTHYQRVDVLKFLFSQKEKQLYLGDEILKDLLSKSLIYKQYTTAQFLLENGVQVDKTNKAVKWSLGEAPVDIITSLQSTGYDVINPDNCLLYSAFKQYPANYKMMDYLLSHGANFEPFRSDIYDHLRDNDGAENVQKLHYLVSKGFDINQDDCKFLMMIVRDGMENLTKAVLCLHPRTYPTEENLFNICAISSNINMFDIVIDSGLLLDSNNKNIISIAATYGNLEAVQYLEKKGFNIEYAQKHGNEEIIVWCDNKLKERFMQHLDNELGNSENDRKKFKL